MFTVIVILYSTQNFRNILHFFWHTQKRTYDYLFYRVNESRNFVFRYLFTSIISRVDFFLITFYFWAENKTYFQLSACWNIFRKNYFAWTNFVQFFRKNTTHMQVTAKMTQDFIICLLQSLLFFDCTQLEVSPIFLKNELK